MNKFNIRYAELLKDFKQSNNLKDEDVAKKLGLSSTANISRWGLQDMYPSIKYLLALSKLFDCSLDYLCGRTDDEGKYKEIKPTLFADRLQEIINSKPNLTRYKLFKDLKLTKGHEFSWFNEHRTPSTINYIKIADYLKVSIDELVGRV